ncbi:FtsX-like permease family protein [Paracoccus bogoriensis]|uniref:ABC transporter permease n=1 Tax=Paracoccus bogoriensis TaxID=242065 RepID=UPI001CA4814D|nr:FtsX-like permease family protein [Paracoccus bogoriensis]MBW7056944.1 FtsX-like permease family protein [Paracoccus bogoriensis]
MSLRIAARIARRELRGGLRGFWILLICLALGVAAIAGVGTVRAAIEAGLQREGAALLGGDAQVSLTYRFADQAEREWFEENSLTVSEIVDFRSMIVVGEGAEAERALTQVKGVDALWPLVGQAVLDPDIPIAQALGVQPSGLPGAVVEPLLRDRLGLQVGDRFRLGVQEFELTAALVSEPDAGAAGFGFGPRTLVLTESLADSQLLGAGTLFDSRYRMMLPPEADPDALRAALREAFPDSGARWRDARRAAPGIEMFVDRIAAFLVLVGLTGLAVGGVGVSAAVRTYLARKTEVIAILKTLGAPGRTIFRVYFIQIGVMALIGVAAGLALGAGVPLLLSPILADRLPVPAVFGLYPAPLAEAALYGLLTAFVFTLWPLARSEQVRAAALFRGMGFAAQGRPRMRHLLAMIAALAALIGAAAWFSGVPELAFGAAVGILGAFLVLLVAALLVRRLARALARRRLVRGRPALRLALAAIGGPREEAMLVILSLGLGLTVLAAVGQVESNLRSAIQNELPERAPAYFFVDIQTDQLPEFMARLKDDPLVSNVETAPMLRGIITRLQDRPAAEVAPGHWVLRGDRGVTYAATPPPGTVLTQGEWWPEDYAGPPLVSISDEIGREIGLNLGDTVTVNILGRDITATIASFREVDFSTAGIGFVMAMNPGALQGAPHTHIATVYAPPEAEAAILRDLGNRFPNITAVPVREAIDRAAEALSGIAAATSWAAAATLLTGFVVLIGAAAAGERARVFEAAVLKTLGAVRGRVLASFALRSALLGAAAGLVALLWGGLAGWAVMRFVMETDFRFDAISAIGIVAGGVLATLLAGLAFVWRPLSARPAQILRAQD